MKGSVHDNGSSERLQSADRKAHAPQRRAVAEPDPAAKDGTAFEDLRPEAPAAEKIRAIIESSPQSQKIAATSAWISNSPRVRTQRKRIENFFGADESASNITASEQKEPVVNCDQDELQRTAVASGERLTSSPREANEIRSAKNSGGLPLPLQSGMEQISGMDLSGVRVHSNSSKPAEISAAAYAQGQDIHLGPGQEPHLPHEAWHTVQQMQGRVQPTVQAKGIAINSDIGLEKEADQMGAKALQAGSDTRRSSGDATPQPPPRQPATDQSTVVQGQWEEIMSALLYGGGAMLIGVATAAYAWWPAGWSIGQLRALARHVALRDILRFANMGWTPANVIALAAGYAAPGANPNGFGADDVIAIANNVAPNSPGDAVQFAGIPGWNSPSIQNLAQGFAANSNHLTAADWAAAAAQLVANSAAEARTIIGTPGWTAPQVLQLAADYAVHVPLQPAIFWRQTAARVGPAARQIIPPVLAAAPPLTAGQVLRAVAIYNASGQSVHNVARWILRGANPAMGAMGPMPGVLAGPPPGPVLDAVIAPGAHRQIRDRIQLHGRPYAPNPFVRQHATTLIGAGMGAANTLTLLTDFCNLIATVADFDQAVDVAEILHQNNVPFAQIQQFFTNHIATAVDPLFTGGAIQDLVARPGVTAASLNQILTTLQPMGNPAMVNLLNTQLADTADFTLARLAARLDYFTQPVLPAPGGLGLAPGAIVANQFQGLQQSLNHRVRHGTMSPAARIWIENAHKLIARGDQAGMLGYLNSGAVNGHLTNPQATNPAYWLYCLARYHVGAPAGGFANHNVGVMAGGAMRNIVIDNWIIDHVQRRHTYEHYQLTPAIINRHPTSALYHPPTNVGAIDAGIAALLNSGGFIGQYPWPLAPATINVGAVQLRLTRPGGVGPYRIRQYYINVAPGIAHDVTQGALRAIRNNFPSIIY